MSDEATQPPKDESLVLPELPPGFMYATSAELFAELGSLNPEKDARAIEAIVRRNGMSIVPDEKERSA